MTGGLFNSLFDWSEFSRLPPLIAALVILAFALWSIWRDWK